MSATDSAIITAEDALVILSSLQAAVAGTRAMFQVAAKAITADLRAGVLEKDDLLQDMRGMMTDINATLDHLRAMENHVQSHTRTLHPPSTTHDRLTNISDHRTRS